jgi:hypothetical protein
MNRHVVTPRASALAMVLIACNPYFVGLSVFVFTDMLALLAMIAVWHGVQTKRTWVAAIGLTTATLTRQYSAFLTAALIICSWLASEDSVRYRVRLTVAAMVAMIPLAALVVLWGGSLSPVNSLRNRYLTEGVRFDPHALSLYLAAPGIYLFPIVAFTLRHASVRAWLIGALGAIWVLAIPVQAAHAQLQDGIGTVGFTHRALLAVGGQTLARVGFATGALISLAALTTWLEAAEFEGTRKVDYLFPWVGVACFLVVMPFSFQPWEKYALSELLLCAVLFARFDNTRRDSSRRAPVKPAPRPNFP